MVLLPEDEKPTKEQFSRYEEIRRAGAHNMMSKEAWMATGLSLLMYEYVIRNYGQLKEEYPDA